MIISFDIWDTIIKRKCHPEEIKLYIAKYITLKYECKLKEEYKDIYKILIKRDDIESQLYKEDIENGNDGEYKIIDVFKRLQDEIFKEKIEDISKELLKEEINQEKRTIYINPDILPIFDKYKNLKMYCISDFYMDENSLMDLLEYLKLPVKIEKVFSSADYLLNKKTGRLYKKMEEEIGITQKEHIHVGDNEYSDIEVAKKMGIETIKIQKSSSNFIPEPGRKIEIDTSSIKLKSDKEYDRLFNEGINIAPLLYFFVYSIVEYSIKNNIPKVYYFTREGETFIKIHEIIKENNPFGVEIPDCEILEVSRMGTFSASLNEFSIMQLLRLWSQYRKQSMKTLFKTLAIDIEPFKKYFSKYDINISEDIYEPWFDVRIHQLCVDEEFLTKINLKLKEKREELLNYFKHKGITNDETPLFIVDIGWRGTIQDNLAHIFTNKKIDGYYLTLYDYYNLQPKNTSKISYIDDKNVRDNEVGSMITLLEWIYNPGTGSVIEYKDGKPIRKVKEDEKNVVEKYIKPLQDGMLEASKLINEYMKYHSYDLKELKQYVYKLMKNIKEKPSKELINVYYNMVFNDTFGTNEYVRKDKKLSIIEKLNIFKCRNMLRKESWKEAFIEYNNMKYMNLLINFKKLIKKVIGRK